MSEILEQLKEYTSGKRAKLIRPIVSIEEWVNSPYYASPDIESLYPFWKQHIINIFNSEVPINEVIVHGSLGSGKSTFACFLALRKIYELSCYDIPQRLFNLQVSTVISAVLFSVNKEVAESGIYGQLRALIDTTPYFQEHFPRDRGLKYDIIWSDKRMRVGFGSNANDQIGQNMYLGILDEGNFFQGEGTLSSKSGNQMSKSQSLYLAIRRRGENRFSSGGVDYSLSVLMSSARTSNSMVEQRIEATRGKKNVYVIHAVSYEVTPYKYSSEKFWCFVGNDLLDPLVINSISDVHNILDSLQEPWPNESDIDKIIENIPEKYRELFTRVPMNLKSSYDSDIISALQDLSGISVSPMGRLFTSRKHFNECVSEILEHPFTQDEFIISTGSEVQIKDYLKSTWKPINPDKPRFLHIDQSTTTDSTGISMVHIDRLDTGPDGEVLPHITVDFMLRINPPLAPNHIDIAKCRGFVLYLANKLGIKIGLCTYDSFQSSESRQQLELAGISTDLLSVDRTATEYKQFCDLIYANRISFYRYSRMEKELFELIYYRDRDKVDHPPVQQGGTKDVMDSLVGAVTNALNSDEIINIQRSGDIDILLRVL